MNEKNGDTDPPLCPRCAGHLAADPCPLPPCPRCGGNETIACDCDTKDGPLFCPTCGVHFDA